MKAGLIISAVLILAISIASFLAWRGVADAPTYATSADKLTKRELPADLPKLYDSAKPDQDAEPLYAAAFDFYLKNKSEFRPEADLPKDLADQLVDMMIEAMDAGQVKPGFLDEKIDVTPNARTRWEEAIELVPAIVVERGGQLADTNAARAEKAGRASFAFGQRAFEKNVRLYNRYQGLHIMMTAGQLLATANEGLGGDVQKWEDALDKVNQNWEKKYALIFVLHPHVGDLINIAQNDADPTFRVEAILKMGIVKYNAGGRGNLRVINETIADAAASSDPLMSAAGKAADALTLDQMRRLK